jgi:hypothetical protein
MGVVGMAGRLQAILTRSTAAWQRRAPGHVKAGGDLQPVIAVPAGSSRLAASGTVVSTRMRRCRAMTGPMIPSRPDRPGAEMAVPASQPQN